MCFFPRKIEKTYINDQKYLESLFSRSLEFLWIGSQSAINCQPEVKLPDEFCNNLLDFLLFALTLDCRLSSLILKMPTLIPFLSNSTANLLTL